MNQLQAAFHENSELPVDPDPHSSRVRRLPNCLIVFLLTSAILLALSLLSARNHSRRGQEALGFDTLYPSWAAFDYYDYINRFQHRHSVQFFSSNEYPSYPWYYPAPAIFVSYPFYLFPADDYGHTGYVVYQVTAIILWLILAGLLAHRLYRTGLTPSRAVFFPLAVLSLSWPLYFALQRGNIEALTWTLVAVAVWALAVRRDLLAGALIGLAGAVKIYPALLFLLFAKPRKWPAIVLGLCVFALVTILGLRFLEPHLADSAQRVWTGINLWTRTYAEVYQQRFDHSAFGLVKRFTHLRPHPNFRWELHRYYLVAAPLFVAGFLRMRSMPSVNHVLFLTCAMVTLPPTSFDYTLCVLYVPLAWLALIAVRVQRTGYRLPALTPVFVLLALITSPEAFLHLHSLNGNPGALKALCLLALMAISAGTSLDVTAPDPREWETFIARSPKLVRADAL